jgi:hypothetical protein
MSRLVFYCFYFYELKSSCLLCVCVRVCVRAEDARDRHVGTLRGGNEAVTAVEYTVAAFSGEKINLLRWPFRVISPSFISAKRIFAWNKRWDLFLNCV